ncbi:hypothetical protein [Paenibacillus pini]|uniref:Uncharacterized protein n=1 Tax=Paenibacillus pini JCM 16418 TaxID=1236976 RepID=W7YPA9_9BACL|nr:hypothetical protein [Paenibacillus pini]GAF06521.1 hypothetical protein JCM16418_480 [Paenibacillus pini JCM 16418]
MATPGITQEELSLIKSYLLLLFIQKVFERDLRIMQESGVFKSPELYTELITNGDMQASMLLSEVKREFKTSQIKVFRIDQDEHGVEAEYVCRGYTGEMDILWSAIRNEMLVRMRAYLGLTPVSQLLGSVSHQHSVQTH